MLLTEPVQITQRIVQEFEGLKIQYYVGGSLASSLHGIPRATQDVDIIADIAFQHIPKLERSYLERSAQQRGVADLLQKVFNDFEIG